MYEFHSYRMKFMSKNYSNPVFSLFRFSFSINLFYLYHSFRHSITDDVTYYIMDKIFNANF